MNSKNRKKRIKSPAKKVPHTEMLSNKNRIVYDLISDCIEKEDKAAIGNRMEHKSTIRILPALSKSLYLTSRKFLLSSANEIHELFSCMDSSGFKLKN
jgi:hypothetical protein